MYLVLFLKPQTCVLLDIFQLKGFPSVFPVPTLQDFSVACNHSNSFLYLYLTLVKRIDHNISHKEYTVVLYSSSTVFL